MEIYEITIKNKKETEDVQKILFEYDLLFNYGNSICYPVEDPNFDAYSYPIYFHVNLYDKTFYYNKNDYKRILKLKKSKHFLRKSQYSVMSIKTENLEAIINAIEYGLL